jgi:hypothetical protein
VTSVIYLPDRDVTPSQPRETAADSVVQGVTLLSDVTATNDLKPADISHCDGVTSGETYGPGETRDIELLLDETEDPYMGPIDYEIAAWIEERVPYTQNLEPCRCIAFRIRGGPILYGGAFNEFRGRDVQYHAACDDPAILTRSRISLLFRYPFEQLGVERISCVIAASNKRSRRVVEGLGWAHEGTIRGFYADDEDGALYGILKSECRWI